MPVFLRARSVHVPKFLPKIYEKLGVTLLDLGLKTFLMSSKTDVSAAKLYPSKRGKCPRG